MKIINDYETLIIGSGAAAFAAADSLYENEVKNIALITENLQISTSRNAGSDKQTYYKLSLCGSDRDCVHDVAEDLFKGGCVDGDVALCEAALSTQCFYKLVSLGIPFPRNRYGEYVGYKTDHDPHERATSAGPYTSKFMTNALENAVKQKNIPIFDHCLVIRILAENGKVRGVVCLKNEADCEEAEYCVFLCNNVIYATGGPGGMYWNSVYPEGQHGSTGLALEAGVIAHNLTEWQYGISSINPRWNVSGTYMQVLPRFVSFNQDMTDEREFLSDYFDSYEEMLNNVFLKGYQWPFDVRKVNGSSRIDLIVYQESCIKKRRVFLDFTKNSQNREINYGALSPEVYKYLHSAGACFGNPYERLCQMNMPAVDFYKNKGVDISKDYLEIAVCAQHNNGGIEIDCWWRTNLEGFFTIGEAAGTHGIYRPGGTALNAGQVGALRAAQYISHCRTDLGKSEMTPEIEKQVNDIIQIGNETKKNGQDKKSPLVLQKENAVLMSEAGAIVRSLERICQISEQMEKQWNNFSEYIYCKNNIELKQAYMLRDTLLSQIVYLRAMQDFCEVSGKSRGSALYLKNQNEISELVSNPDGKLEYDESINQTQEIGIKEGKIFTNWREVRPIPEEKDIFETVWKSFRENENIY